MSAAKKMDILKAVPLEDTLSQVSHLSVAITKYRKRTPVNAPSSKTPGMATANPKASASLRVVSKWIFNLSLQCCGKQATFWCSSRQKSAPSYAPI